MLQTTDTVLYTLPHSQLHIRRSGTLFANGVYGTISGRSLNQSFVSGLTLGSIQLGSKLAILESRKVNLLLQDCLRSRRLLLFNTLLLK